MSALLILMSGSFNTALSVAAAKASGSSSAGGLGSSVFSTAFLSNAPFLFEDLASF
jgi:hypothetical protein